MSPDLRPVGDRGVLVEVADAAAAIAFAGRVRDRLGDAVEDVVPAHETVLVTWRGAPDRRRLLELLEAPAPPRPATGPIVEIAVRYDGPDLAEVAQRAGVSPEEIARRHRAPEYVAAFTGFAPGFAYLLGTDPMLHLPRRDVVRERVPAGSVAIAAGYTSIYPRASPGGWWLLGSTDVVLFDAARDAPVLLAPGTRVRLTQ